MPFIDFHLTLLLKVAEKMKEKMAAFLTCYKSSRKHHKKTISQNTNG